MRNPCRTTRSTRAGFTLIEVLAAFGITAVIILCLGPLIHHVGLTFDRGIIGVNEAERFALAMDRLARDFGAARFTMFRGGVSEESEDGPEKAKGGIAFVAQANKVTFVSGGASPPYGAEVVTLKVEPLGEDLFQLVRRRTVWLGPSAPSFEEATEDAVVLLKGHYTISFSFGKLGDDGAVAWAETWSDSTLPRLVRLNLRDIATGGNLLAGSEFILHADAASGGRTS